MGQYVLLLVVALTVGAVVFGVTVLVSGGDPGLDVAEPDGRAVPLPGTRPLAESDVAGVRFDTAARGYRMDQVDQALRRAAYDIGYKDELISVLEAEITALREGRIGDADVLRDAREAAVTPAAGSTPPATAATRGPGAPAEPAVIDIGLVTGSEPAVPPEPAAPAGQSETAPGTAEQAAPAEPVAPGEPERSGNRR
jgi:DivIVA domain-containing protein